MYQCVICSQARSLPLQRAAHGAATSGARLLRALAEDHPADDWLFARSGGAHGGGARELGRQDLGGIGEDADLRRDVAYRGHFDREYERKGSEEHAQRVRAVSEGCVCHVIYYTTFNVFSKLRSDTEFAAPAILTAVHRVFRLLHRSSPWLVLGLLLFAVLWRGGKSVEATWLLAGVSVWVTFGWWGTVDRHGAEPVPRFLWWVLAGFIAWTGLSFFVSTTANYGLDEVLRDASLALIFLWTVRMRKTPHSGEEFLLRVITLLAVATLVACAVGIAVYALQPVNRFVGTFFDARFHTDYWPNAWADLVLLAWPAVLLWSWNKHPVVRIFSLGLVMGTLLLSYSRGGFLACAGQSALLILIGIGGGFLRSPRSLLHAGFTLVGVTALSIIVFGSANLLRAHFHPVQSVGAKVTFTSDEGLSSVNERRQFWSQAFSLANQRPLTGWGPYSFRFIQPRLQHGVLQTSDHAHNLFLKLAAERGWPAALFLILLLCVILVRALMHLRSASNTHLLLLHAVPLIAVAGVLAHSMIDYNLQFVGVALPFWLMLGFLVGADAPRTHAPRGHAMPIAEIILAMVIGIVAFAEGRYLVLSSLGRHAEAAGDTQIALRWYEQSVDERFSRDLHLSRANLFLQQADLEAADAALDRSLSQNAEDARAWILVGDLLLREENPSDAAMAYNRAFTLGKYNYLEALIGLLTSLRDAGDHSALVARHSEFLSLAKAYHDAILQNAHFIALGSSVETYASATNLLVEIYPEDAALLDQYNSEARTHAAEERQRFGSRAGGFLW